MNRLPVDDEDRIEAALDYKFRVDLARQAEYDITVDLRTGGWSENEAIVDALLANSVIRMLYYHSWERGGKHVFKFYKLTK